jgi:hypothetical protein
MRKVAMPMHKGVAISVAFADAIAVVAESAAPIGRPIKPMKYVPNAARVAVIAS